METLTTAAQDDSSEANTISVKSDDGSSSPHESARGSPPPNCAICLGTCRNKSFTDSCLHQFCFKCLLTWSKVKAECPLCKQTFKSIIHNVQSNHQYEEYMVEQRHTEETTERIDMDNLTATRRFRYRTTLTLPRRDTLAIQQLLLHYPLMTDVLPNRPNLRRRSPTSFRRTVYRLNLWARPLPDFTGRFRDCSPTFYRYNDSQMHRLVPWLTRELQYLLNENFGHISYVISKVLELLPQHHINSPEFREAMYRYFGARTEHFLHELYCFAATPYDMTGYDRSIQYTTDTRITTMVNEIISSSESEASVDSDIVMVSSSEPAGPPAGPSRVPPGPSSVPPGPSRAPPVPSGVPPPPGPSRLPAPAYPQNYIPNPTTNNVIPIETLSQSDTDDDSSEVMLVGYIKPPQDRTPEVVDLLGSDSDVIVQDNVPEPSQSRENQETRTSLSLVKLSLKKHRTHDCDSDSEDTTYRTPPPKRKKRQRSNDTATTSDTCRTTPSPARSWVSKSRSPSRSRSTSTNSSNASNDSSSASYKSANRKKRLHKKNLKRKTKEANTTDKNKGKRKKRPSRTQQKEKTTPNALAPNDKSRKHKSFSGKGVKSSNKTERNSAVATADAAVQAAPAIDQPSTSGTANKKANDSEKSSDRSVRESRRLKSVVNVINSHRRTNGSSTSCVQVSSQTTTVINTSTTKSNICTTIIKEDMGRKTVITSSSKSRKVETVSPRCGGQTANKKDDNVTDSDDDLPLNLTVRKKSPC